MKTKSILCAIAITSLGFSSLSHAQPSRDGPRQDSREARQDIRDARGDLRRAPNQRAANDARRDVQEGRRDLREARDDRRDDRRDARDDRRDARRYYNARTPEFRRGGRLPQEMRDRQYVVNDWRGHHLAAPPRGQQWVQVGPDYVLAAIVTGIIATVVLSQ
jgi:Ni/Co efflux regulator RcnB